MKKMVLFFLSLFFPWLILLLHDNPGGALVALVMQVTLIGWPFATFWAWGVIKADKKNKRTT